MLAVFFILAGFIPLNYAALQLSLVESDKLLTNQLIDSVFLTLPPCTESGKLVDVEYVNMKTSEKKVVANAFAIPTCDTVCCPNEPTTVSRKIGYQLAGLNSNTTYTVRYKVGPNYSDTLTLTTRAASDYNVIDTSLPGRSAAMVVITAILSVAMFILLVSLIVGLVMPKNS